MTKKEIVNRLKEIQEQTVWSTVDSDCTEAMNLCIDLQNEGDYGTEYITAQIVDEYLLRDYVDHRLKDYGPIRVAEDLKGIDSDTGYYWIDDTYGDVTSVDPDKLRDIIDDMIDAIDLEDEEEN